MKKEKQSLSLAIMITNSDIRVQQINLPMRKQHQLKGGNKSIYNFTQANEQKKQVIEEYEYSVTEAMWDTEYVLDQAG